MSLSQRFFSEAFRDMQRAMTTFDQSFYNSGRRSVIPSSLLNNDQLFRYPAADMAETLDAYKVSAELPGYDKSDIKIELTDNHTLVLSGTVNEQHETSPSETPQDDQVVKSKDTVKPQYWVKERTTGSFSRSFSFPQPINPDSIKASFENGVLKVTIPKTSESQPKKINIE